MADISQEIAAFQNAVYGEEVRSSMVSAIEKINDVCEDAESTVEGFSSGVTQAISNANTAASAANTAASNANTKASAANTAATNANTAKTAANNAATAANNAASAATTTNNNITNAESARVSAENARATAESARQANEQSRQTAETARVNAESARASAESSRASAESQRQSNESTRQGNENVRQTQEGMRVSAESSRVSEFEDMQAAFADMQRQIIPQATTSTMGGVIVGDGLNVDNALLSLATTKSGSGTAVASSGAVLESVVVYGQSVQDGTPTPDAPVDVQVVQGANLLPVTTQTRTNSGVTATVNADGSVSLSGTSTAERDIYIYGDWQASSVNFDLTAGSYYTLSITPIVSGVVAKIYTFTSEGTAIVGIATDATTGFVTFRAAENMKRVGFSIRVASGVNVDGVTVRVQFERGSTATPYIPYGFIGIVIGDTATPIDLQGNVLASLPDGTKDVLTVDSAGHCVLEKRVEIIEGGESGVSAYYNTVHHATGVSFPAKPYPAYRDNLQMLSDQFVFDGAKNGDSAGAGMQAGKFGYYRVSSGATPWYIYFKTTDTFTSQSDVANWLSTHKPKFYYQKATPETIDLGYIDMPTIPEDATISVSASITPVIDAAWWERGAEALANIVKALSERIRALEEAVAELATA